MENLLAGLSEMLPGKICLPGDEQYVESLNTYFSTQESKIEPACILRPQTTADVAAAVSLLVEADRKGVGFLKFAVRSGGHASFSESANSAGGVTIDLRSLNSIDIDKSSSRVVIGAGSSWGEVYRTLEPLGWTVPGGRHSQVGVGGLTLGGGLSHFSAKVGLVCDNVLEYEVVLASGEVSRVTESEHSDLFHALRGGSNNFGIVTRFTFRSFPQGQLWGGTLIHPLETKVQQLEAFYNFSANTEYDRNASLIQSFGLSAKSGTGCVNSIVYTKPEDNPDVIKPFTSIDSAYTNTLRELSLTELTREQDAFNENGLCQLTMATTYYLHLPLLHRTIDLWQASCNTVRSIEGIVWSLSFQPIVPAIISKSHFLQSAVPFLPSPLKSIVIAQLTGTWKEMKDTPAVEAAALKLIGDIEAAAEQEAMQTGYIYLNYAHPGQRVFGEGERRERLREVSRRYDPEGIFQRCVPGGFKLF